MPNFNPLNPTKFLGTNKYITFFVSRNRQPTSADYRQPETGTLYSVGTVWQVSKDPTTGTEGQLWMLSKIVANQGYWILVNGAPGAVIEVAVQTGTSPVLPDSNGLLTFNGAVVAAGTNPVRTDGTGANTMALEVQISQAIASTNATNIGLSAFNSAHFSVDANGFVSLAGGGQAVDSFQVDAFTGPGTNPVVPNSSGVVTVTGSQIATGTIGANVIRTVSLAANTYAVQIQQSAAAAAVNTALNGVAHFDSTSFTVGSGFVALSGAKFSAYLNPGVTNVTGDGTLYTIIYNSTFFDTGSGFNTTTGVYTIPAGLGGTWMFTVRVAIQTTEALHTAATVTLTSSGSFNQVFECNPFACKSSVTNTTTNAYTVIQQVSAGTLMSVILSVFGGPKTCGINGSSTLFTTFEGYRLGS